MAMVSSTTRSIQETPTWAVAIVCFAFIFISILLNYLIHRLSSWLKKQRKKSLSEAVEKLKAELMLVGFMSLLLAIAQRPISYICIPVKVDDTMLPCNKLQQKGTGERGQESSEIHRKLSSSAVSVSDHCGTKGMVSLVSQNGIHQLHIFIFVLAVMHVLYCVMTMALGRAKMRRWKSWEKETQTTEYQVANDPGRFRLIRQTTFARRHMSSWTKTFVHIWIKCFFRQFFNSVAKVDYFTLRHGFISTHLPTTRVFNFQKYIQRSLEDDFKVVVGISPVMWLLVVIFLLIDVHGVYIYFWISFIPLIIVLAVGTKLEVIVARMALRLKEQSTVIKGTPQVQPNDELFWFGWPKLVLILLHFTLFMNAFQLTFFVWITYEFGLRSCYHESLAIVIARVVLAFSVATSPFLYMHL
ncbi:MLO-like protein 3 isoform X2 [Tasmannia lanceolata]|uniref:MLO-like protein 3 isoform X2 n=1 Tax=Tasmannia lanceolata TaxID=3420 RepID=UPI0040638D63